MPQPLIDGTLDELEKIAGATKADTVFFGTHPDAKTGWEIPTSTVTADLVESFAPFHMYNRTRNALQGHSNKKLLRDLKQQGNLARPWARAMVDEARDRGLALPKGALPEGDRREPPSSLFPLLAAVLGSGITAGAAEVMIPGKKPLFSEATAPTLRELHAKMTPDELAAEKLVRYLRKSGVMTHVQDLPEHFNPNGRLVPLDPRLPAKEGPMIVVKPTSRLPVFAHEAGHATGKGLLRKVLMKAYGPAKMYGIYGMPAAATAAHVVLGDTSFQGSDEERADRIRTARNVAALSALPYAPVLAEEARATIRGTKILSKLRGKGQILRSAKVLAPAFATYLAALAGPATAIGLLHRDLKKAEGKLQK